MRRFLLPALVCGVLAAILFFALKPNRNNNRGFQLPRPVVRWLNAHDDAANFLAFTFFGALVFALPENRPPGARPSRQTGRLGLLLALVSGLEIAQIWIPGRISSWRDVGTGSAGVCCAWLARQIHRRISRKRAP